VIDLELITNQQKKDYLRQYRKAINEMERLIVRRLRLTNISGQSLGSIRGSDNNVDKLTDTISDIMHIEQKFFDEEKLKQEAINGVILRAIANLGNSRERQVLILKYIDCLSWKEISISMQYEERQVFRVHGKALHNIKIDPV
jgi:DNA-directed RNA polymerase specialized sigma subunit